MHCEKAAAKAALRRKLRAERRALSAPDHDRRSRLAAKPIERLPQFSAGRRIALYLPFDREVDTARLIAAARRRGVRVYVPVVVDRRHRRIALYPLSRKTRRGTFGIRIPDRASSMLGARWFNLIVVPMVGVDRAGRRLGMGGGFYDRLFAFRRHRHSWRAPRLVGLAFDCQRVATVEPDSWDLRLDAVATESGLQTLGPSVIR
jgi:5-formyltetrahydrofolate cyclo-ligase